MVDVKQELARRQLGTALALFIANDDPVSVHCLACGGAELADHLSKAAGEASFVDHVLDDNPTMNAAALISLRNHYWNAMKHSSHRNGRIRDDEELMSNFDDTQNDHILFIGWLDYASAVHSLPIEAQVFQVWYFARYPEKLAPEYPRKNISEFFPNLMSLDRNASKTALKKRIAWARQKANLMSDPKTDRRKLILGPVPMQPRKTP